MGNKKKRSQSRQTESDKAAVVRVGRIEQSILLIRGEKVILDADLAHLYGVETKRLNEQVKRNSDRFPEDFVFQLTWQEAKTSRSQFATLKRGKNIKYRPYAFTEHGAIMAANVLNSPRAVQVSVYVVRAFVRLRRMLLEHKEVAAKLAELERKVGEHDEKILALIEAIRQLIAPPPDRPRNRIGFQAEAER